MARIFLLIAITLLSLSKVKASSLEDQLKNSLVVEDLLNAADKLNGVGKNLCLFLAQDMPSKNDAKSFDSANWIKAGASLNKLDAKFKRGEVNTSLNKLAQTDSGKKIFKSLEKAGIKNKYEPVTIHVGSIKELINIDRPMAFNSMVQTNPRAKALPFIVLNKKYSADSQKLTVVIANELYDILGRISAGERVTASSNYQALGIILSDVVLKDEISKNSSSHNRNEIIATYKKAIKNYSSVVPPINVSTLNNNQLAALNNLTVLATGGLFKTFSELETATFNKHLALK